MQHTRQVAQQVEATRLLFYSSFVDEQDNWPSSDFHKQLQEGDDLGERMQRAFAVGFRHDGPVVIIGSDCAQLTPQIVRDAFTQLEDHDFVVGPADDGGYYLLGMRTYTPSIFDNIVWSTEEVFPATIRKMTDAGWSYALLPTLSDIDYAEDWERYGWEL
jgi:hypothetical protein